VLGCEEAGHSHEHEHEHDSPSQESGDGSQERGGSAFSILAPGF
jgi:hypothetical protein